MSEANTQPGPPYPPEDAGLGGRPDIIPDVPVSSVILAAYLVLGVVHWAILKKNQGRGHKFLFNGAILGLCKIRLVTLSLRLAWACYPTHVQLAIAANIFVYIGTIILYLVNWFFVQRIIRAQHPGFGWSTSYRIIHRGGIIGTVLAIIMLIIAAIWHNYTRDKQTVRILRYCLEAGQSWLTAFCLAPALLILLSLVIPRTTVEKFGAGRLRINITILMVAVFILSIGQVFRCVIFWLPATPLLNASGAFTVLPWYLSKACFYAFNFATELTVVLFYAVVRADLRFYIPNGARRSGDYSTTALVKKNKEKSSSSSLEPVTNKHVMFQNNNASNETLHEYEAHVFNDSKTLADSLKFGSSTLEVDQTTGTWKVKRISADGSSSSRASLASPRSPSRTSLSHPSPILKNGNASGSNTPPPMPSLPKSWPLPPTALPRSSVPILEHPDKKILSRLPARASDTHVHMLRDEMPSALAIQTQARNPKREVQVYQPSLPVPRSYSMSDEVHISVSQTTSPVNEHECKHTRQVPRELIPHPKVPAPSTATATAPPAAAAHEMPRSLIPGHGPGPLNVLPSPEPSTSPLSVTVVSASSVDASEYARAQREFRRFSWEVEGDIVDSEARFVSASGSERSNSK